MRVEYALPAGELSLALQVGLSHPPTAGEQLDS